MSTTFEFFLALTRSRYKSNQVQSFEQDLAEINWPELLRLAERHQVSPIIYNALRLVQLKGIPRSFSSQLRFRVGLTVKRNRLFAEEVVRLNALLDRTGTQVLFYKGPMAAIDFYTDLGARVFGDIDFLVRSEDLGRVVKTLEGDGFRNTWFGNQDEQSLMEEQQKEYCFKKGPITLEPHWSITARRFPFDIDYPMLWQRFRYVDFDGSQIPTFSIEDSLIIYCVCGSKGQWHRMQMITDIAEALRTHQEVDWVECFQRAEQCGVARMLKLGLALANRILGVELAPEPERVILKDKAIGPLVDDITLRLSYPKTENVWTRQGPRVFSPLLFRLRDTTKDKLLYLLRTTTTPHTIHQRRFPLPRVLYSLYYVIVPIYDYILYPIFTVTRASFKNQKSN